MSQFAVWIQDRKPPQRLETIEFLLYLSSKFDVLLQSLPSGAEDIENLNFLLSQN
jgi:hypothetical protein